MNVGIIGAGKIGATVARLLVQAGYQVALSNSRGPESLQDVVREMGPDARAMTRDDAARWAEVVLLAVPFRNPEAFPSPETVRGKIVIDATNPYGADFSIMDLGDKTSSEVVAERLPGARLVKAFNTIYFQHLAQQGDTSKPLEQRRAIFLAGDDPEAKASVSSIIENLGFAPVDSGSLREGGRRQEPDSPIYNQDLTAAQARSALASLV